MNLFSNGLSFDGFKYISSSIDHLKKLTSLKLMLTSNEVNTSSANLVFKSLAELKNLTVLHL